MQNQPATKCHRTLGAEDNHTAGADGIQGRKEFGSPSVIPSVVLSGGKSLSDCSLFVLFYIQLCSLSLLETKHGGTDKAPEGTALVQLSEKEKRL